MSRCRLSGVTTVSLVMLVLVFETCDGHSAARAAEFRGRVVDDSTGEPIPARVYLQNEAGEWLFVTSAAADGSALPYREQWVPMTDSAQAVTRSQ